MNKPSFLKRSVKHLVLFLLMLLSLFMVARIGLNLLGTEEEQIQTLERWGNSPALTWIRYGIYALIVVFWKALLRKLNNTLPDETVRATYRPLIVTLILYEFLFARGAVSQLLN